MTKFTSIYGRLFTIDNNGHNHIVTISVVDIMHALQCIECSIRIYGSLAT